MTVADGTGEEPVILCRASDVADGEARGFPLPGEGRRKVIVVRKGETIRAYRDACPHFDGTPMAWRTNAYLNGDGTHLACHSHGALFDIDTGACVQGPCLGLSLTSLAILVTGNGDICVFDKI